MAARSTTFTTYWNAKEAPAANQALDRFTDRAVASYATIARAADQASAASAGLVGGRGAANGAQLNQQLKQREAITRNVTSASERASVASGKLANALRHEGDAAATAARKNSNFARSLEATATALNVVQGPLGPLAGRVRAAASAFETLTGVRLGLVGVGAALFALGQNATKFTEIESKLRPLFETQTEVNRALDQVSGIAKRARTSLEPVADLYSRLTLAGRDFGFSQQRVARLTELATKAATLSGGSNQSRQAGLGQFAQGIGSGNLGGDELRSIKENTLVLAQQIAAGFKNADGSIGTTIGHLKELGSEGKLTSVEIADALERSANRIETSYARLPKTISTAGAQFGNALLISIGRFDQAIGFSGTLANLLSEVADNLRVIISLAAGVGTAFAILKGAEVAKGIAAQAAAAISTARQVKELDAAWVAEAGAAQRASVARVAELEAERLEIRRTIVELERKRAAEAASVGQLSPLATTGSASRQRLYQPAFTAANRDLERSTLALAHTQSELTRVNRELKGAVVASEVATSSFGVATQNVAKRTGVFRSALNGILGVFGGPWGLALTAATTALYLYVTAETNAERAVRLHESAQRDFGTIIDQTTGKIYKQITALEIQAKKKAVKESLDVNAGQFIAQRNSLASAISGFGSANRDSSGRVRNATPEERAALNQLSALAARVKTNTFTYDEVDRELRELGKRYKGIRDRLPEFGQRLADLRASGERVRTDAAGLRIGTGAERATDTAVFLGRLTPTQARSRKSDAVLNAEADAAAKLGSGDSRQQAAGRRQTSLLALQKERANGLGDDEYLARRKEILLTYDQEIQGIRANRAATAASNRDARHDAAEARKDAREAERERIQTAKETAQARLESSQTDLEDRRPLLTTQEYLDARIAILKTYDDEFNAIDGRTEKSHRAADQELRDARAVGAIRTQIANDFDREVQIASLLLQGREDEANALRRTLEIVEQIGDAGYREYSTLLTQERAHERINDLLASRDRITGAITATLDTARDSFEQFLVDLPSKGASAGGDLLKNIQASLNRAFARRITETLFAGADEKLRRLIRGNNSVEDATDRFAGQVDQTSEASSKLATALEESAVRIEQASSQVAGAITAAASPTGPAGSGNLAAGQNSGLDRLLADYIQSGESARHGGVNPDGTPVSSTAGDIIVTAQAVPQIVAVAQRRASFQQQASLGGTIFEALGSNLDSVVNRIKGRSGIAEGLNKNGSKATIENSSQFFSKMGKTFGTALEGAGQGAIASGFVKALGIKQSKTGAQIGGAIGSFIPGVGPIIGGIIGGTIGGLLKKTKTGTATIGNVNGLVGETGTSGNSAGFRKEASGIASTVGSTIDQIVQQLGAQLGDFKVSIGKRNKKFVVDPTGAGRTKGSGVLKFTSVEEAEQAAIRDALIDGAAKGISQAAQNILARGKDLQTAVEKAAIIESIPRRLLQRTDPVRYAVEELNREFTRTIAVLKEGGASAAQFADAQKLYELERADAVKQATAQAASAIDQFIKDMVGGTNSPLNKLDTYQNASTALNAFKADIAGGKIVDQNDLLSAARNFQDASRNLNGSSEAFFTDFNALRDLLTKARDNAGITNVSTLPASPFTQDASVEAAIQSMNQSTVAATRDQTAQIVGAINDLMGLFQFAGYSPAAGISSIGGLPGFSPRAPYVAVM